MLAFKVASIVNEDVALRFWKMLLERNDAKQKAALPEICQALMDRVGELPDKRSRDIITESLSWALDNPEAIHIHLDSRQARNGHLPNMVAFANLLDGLEGYSKRWARKVRRIIHDRQSEFDKTLAFWHEMFSNASDEPMQLVGEVVVVQKVVGSEFEVKAEFRQCGHPSCRRNFVAVSSAHAGEFVAEGMCTTPQLRASARLYERFLVRRR